MTPERPEFCPQISIRKCSQSEPQQWRGMARSSSSSLALISGLCVGTLLCRLETILPPKFKPEAAQRKGDHGTAARRCCCATRESVLWLLQTQMSHQGQSSHQHLHQQKLILGHRRKELRTGCILFLPVRQLISTKEETCHFALRSIVRVLNFEISLQESSFSKWDIFLETLPFVTVYLNLPCLQIHPWEA